ncbi:MAG: metallophosphoesterase family protein [Burkholderiaceae bacterium]
MRILLITDSHLANGAPELVANWRAASRYAERSAVDLTIHLGDISFDAINREAQLREAKALVDAWPTPMRLIPGNHDIGDNPGTRDVPAREWLTAASRARYLATFGEDRWAIDAEGWRLIAFDAQLFGSGTAEEDEQWEWINSEFHNAAGKPVIVLLHKPLFENPLTDRDHHMRYVPLAARDRLLALIATADVRLVLCGHAHQYLDRTIDGVRHVWLPSCAFIIPDPHQKRFGEKIVGVGVLELERDGGRDGCGYGLDVVAADGLVAHDITQLRGLMNV